MNVANFMSGNFLTHLDLPEPVVTWTISGAKPQKVGTDDKVCLSFQEIGKPLALNKGNLKVLAALFGYEADAWVGKALKVYRASTQYQGQQVLCVRVCSAETPPPEMVFDTEYNAVPAQANATPQQAQAEPPAQPVAAPAAAPQASDEEVPF